MTVIDKMQEITSTYFCYKGYVKKVEQTTCDIEERTSPLAKILMLVFGLAFTALTWLIISKPEIFAQRPPSWASIVTGIIGSVMMLFSLIANRYVLISFSSITKDVVIVKNNLFFSKQKFHYKWSDISLIQYVTFEVLTTNSKNHHKQEQWFAAEIHFTDGKKIRCSSYMKLKMVEEEINKLSSIIGIHPSDDVIDVGAH